MQHAQRTWHAGWHEGTAPAGTTPAKARALPVGMGAPPAREAHLCQQQLREGGVRVQPGQQVGLPDGHQLEHAPQEPSHLRRGWGARWGCWAQGGASQP